MESCFPNYWIGDITRYRARFRLHYSIGRTVIFKTRYVISDPEENSSAEVAGVAIPVLKSRFNPTLHLLLDRKKSSIRLPRTVEWCDD